VAEHRGDGLGCQRVPELMRVNMRQPGSRAGPVDHPGDGVPVQGAAVLAWQQQRMAGGDIARPVVIDQGYQLRVQRKVAVFAELADRDVQPRPGADLHDGISAQRGVLADPQAGAQQHLHGDADQPTGSATLPSSCRR
jgi:hypothetical protein